MAVCAERRKEIKVFLPWHPSCVSPKWSCSHLSHFGPSAPAWQSQVPFPGSHNPSLAAIPQLHSSHAPSEYPYPSAHSLHVLPEYSMLQSHWPVSTSQVSFLDPFSSQSQPELSKHTAYRPLWSQVRRTHRINKKLTETFRRVCVSVVQRFALVTERTLRVTQTLDAFSCDRVAWCAIAVAGLTLPSDFEWVPKVKLVTPGRTGTQTRCSN